MNKTFDRFAALAFLIIGTVFMLESLRISKSAYGSNIGPNVFPFLLGLILALLSVKLFLETLRYRTSYAPKRNVQYKTFLILLVSSILYALLLESVGYVITTFVFLVIGFQTIEKGDIWKSILIAACFSFGVYFLYVKVLQGTLPSWPIWFS
jgi:putative tricarboxylic transport membrane protein